MSALKICYESAKENPSDINEHLDVLFKYAKECNSITEFGVRNVTSTWAFGMARPKIFISYDIERKEPCTTDAENIMRNEGVNWNFKIGDTREINIEQTDLLFIDTNHKYEILKVELNRHHSKVNKYIIMHDTTTFEGLRRAINEFLQVHKEWKIKEVYTNNNGLTVLERNTQ